jgi:hypothetical protein
MKTTVKKIEYLSENRKSKRALKITLSNKTVIRAMSCHESWEQWGGTTEELYITMPIVELHNDWLHGGSKPYADERR